MLSDPERARLVEVITYHWMRQDASCGCGWAELGKSHPEHVVEVFMFEEVAR